MAAMIPSLSVVLCTHNRVRPLEAALHALLGQAPGTPPYEVIVVDNASTDDTPARLQAHARRLGGVLRVVSESRLGLSHARNTGVAAARAPLVAFTDDDVRVSPDWVGTIVALFAAHPEAEWMGGRVLPRWRAGPPSWLTRDDWAPLALQDHGDRPFAVGAGRPVCLIGANLAVRVPSVHLAGGFDPQLQRVGEGVGSTEDHGFQEQLWRRGLTGRYEPAMLVEAEVDSARRSKRYHRRWHLGHGRYVARMQLPEMEAYGGRRCRRVPLHLLRSTHPWFALGFSLERLASPPARPRPIANLVSIVIPCFNHQAFLGEAITSALGHPRCEVIVVDDGSTDDSARVASEFVRVRLLRQPNRGVAAARNTGLHSARGEFVMFLDADDRLRPGAVDRLRQALQRSPDAAFARGRFEMIDAGGQPVISVPPVRHAVDAYEALLRSNFICVPGTVMYRRAAVLDAGGFRPADAAADYDLYLRLARGSRLIDVDAVVADYRGHGANMSGRADRMLRETLATHRRARRGLRTAEERRAWAAGRKYWRLFYGTQLVDQLRRQWRTRHVAAVVRDCAVLARCAPGVLLRHVGRKLTQIRPPYRTRYTAKRPSS